MSQPNALAAASPARSTHSAQSAVRPWAHERGGAITRALRTRYIFEHFLRLSTLLAAAGALGFSSIARSAETTGPLDDTFNISVGTFFINTDTRVGLNGSTGEPGTEVNLNRDLGLGNASRFRVDATWRFFKRHKLRAFYFTTSQHASVSAGRDLTIGDTTYPVNANLYSTNSTSIAELAYEYAFWQRDNLEITASAGLHIAHFNLGVSGDGTVNGHTGQFSTETANATAPLPVIGARALWEFLPRWYLDAQAQYFAVRVDNVSGHLAEGRAGITRMFGSHFGVGIGWNQFGTRVDIDKLSFEGSLRWRYSGGLIYLTGSF